MFISYAQNFEDVMLWRALGQVTNGFYIDIGAQDPLIDSVSLAFYERGWRGVHVEPSPMYAEKLRQARPDETVIQAAIDSHGSLFKFYEFPETGLSTGEAEIAQKHQAVGFSLREIEVPCLMLASLLDRYADREIHWLKIDVEGMEQRVIESWKPSKVRPWILVVESTLPLEQTQSHLTWDPLVQSLDYKFVYFDGLNRFYISKAHKDFKKFKKAFMTGPNVFDGFALNGTASADFCHVIQERHRSQLSEVRLEFEKQTESSQQSIEHLTQVINAREQVQAEQARIHAEREQSLATELQHAQDEQRRIEQEGAGRERDLTQVAFQSKQGLEGLLRHVAQREKEFGEQLLQVRQDAQEELRQVEQALIEQLQSAQRELLNLEREWVQAEKALNQEIIGLQSEIQAANHAQQLQAQQHGFGLTTKQDKLNRLIQTCADLEAQLKDQILSKQQTSLQLRQKIAEVEKNLAITHASLSWRMTAPLRQIASFIAPRKGPGHSFSSVEPVEPPRVIEPTVSGSQSTEVQITSPAAMELIMPHSTQTINLNGPAIAATLDELLALHDQSFIHCAYQTLLGRDPDEAGLNYYLGRLRTGIPKIQILGELRRSEEGKAYAADLPRLDAAIRRYRWAHKAIIGRLVRPFVRVEENNSTERKLRGLESQPISESQPTKVQPTAPAAMKLIMPHSAQDTNSNTPTIAATLDELLACHDRVFIHCAYQTLLGRDPDEEGLSYYLGRLRTGIPKIQILGQLRRSEEGRDYEANLPRLDAAIRRYRWAQNRIIGWLVRLFTRVEGNNATERKLRGLESQLFLVGEANLRRFDQMENAMTGLHRLATDQIEQIKAIVAAVVPAPKPSGAEVVKNFSPRARDIYFQLKTAAAIHAERSA